MNFDNTSAEDIIEDLKRIIEDLKAKKRLKENHNEKNIPTTS